MDTDQADHDTAYQAFRETGETAGIDTMLESIKASVAAIKAIKGDGHQANDAWKSVWFLAEDLAREVRQAERFAKFNK